MFAPLKKLFGAKSAPAPRPRPGEPGYTPGAILFVDDEAEVRAIARLSLEPLGYTLIEAEDGAKALDIFERRRAEIGLVITDVLMPNLDGLGLSSRLHRIDPDLPILLLSGHVLEEDLWAEGNARMRYLMKPYRLQDLHDIITDLIGPPPTPPSA
jgi:CheY-like chemotaxis protein